MYKSKAKFLFLVLPLIFLAIFIKLPKKNDQISIYVKPVSDPIYTLDPAKSRFRVDYMIARSIYGQLLKTGSSGEIKPAFVKSWEIKNEGREFILNLRTDVYFHSGKKANSDDVIYTINYLSSPGSLISQLFKDIVGFENLALNKNKKLVGVTKINDHTVKILLKKTSYVFLVNLSDPKVVVLPNDLNGLSSENFFKKPDGIGAYKLEESTRDGKYIKLVANEKYFLEKPKISTYIFKYMVENDAIVAFKEGKVADLELYVVPKVMHDSLKKVGNEYTVASYSTAMVFFNSKNKFLSKVQNRKLLSNAINVSKFEDSCGSHIIRSTGFIPHGVPGWLDLKALSGESKTLLSNKLPNMRPLNFVSYGNSIEPCLINAVISQFKSSGIEIIHEHLDRDSAVTRFVKGEYDLWIDDLYVRNTDPFHLMTFLDPSSAHYLMTFKDNKISQEISMIEKTPSLKARGELYRKLNMYISHNQQYIIPLFTEVRHYFFNRTIRAASVPATISLDIGFEETWIQ